MHYSSYSRTYQCCHRESISNPFRRRIAGSYGVFKGASLTSLQTRQRLNILHSMRFHFNRQKYQPQIQHRSREHVFEETKFAEKPPTNISLFYSSSNPQRAPNAILLKRIQDQDSEISFSTRIFHRCIICDRKCIKFNLFHASLLTICSLVDMKVLLKFVHS